MHDLLPLHWCCDLLRQEIGHFFRAPEGRRGDVAVHWNLRRAERDFAEGIFHGFLCRGHELGVEGATDWESFRTTNSKCLGVFLNKI